MFENKSYKEPTADSFLGTLGNFMAVAEENQVTESAGGLLYAAIGAVSIGIGAGLASRGNPEAGVLVAGVGAAEALIITKIVLRLMREVVNQHHC